MPHGGTIDILLTLWASGLFVMNGLFVRYVFRLYQEDISVTDIYDRLAIAIGMFVYQTGNLIVLCWFLFKMHLSDSSPLDMYDPWIIILGAAISIAGVFCKIRIFSDSTKEIILTTAVLVFLSFATVFF